MSDWYAHWLEVRSVCALANLGICLTVAWICLCRISAMSAATTRLTVRGAYAISLTSAVAVGSMPLWGDWPGAGELLMGTAQLSILWMSRGAWGNGPPPHARCK